MDIGKENFKSRTAPTSTSPFLDSFPTEIKLLVLRSVTDYKALRALVHASPAYHQTYLLARDEILTNVTLPALKARKINVLIPMHFVEACVRGHKEPDPNLQPALQNLYNQLASNSPIKLSADHCVVLFTLVDLKGYRDRALASTTFGSDQFQCLTHAEVDYLCGWRSYHLLSFGSQSATACASIKRQLGVAHFVYGRTERIKALRTAAAVRKVVGKKPGSRVSKTPGHSNGALTICAIQ